MASESVARKIILSLLLFFQHNVTAVRLTQKLLPPHCRRSGLTVEQFIAEYEVPNRPVVITDVVSK